MKNTVRDIGIASQIATYNDAIEASPGKLLFLSGTPCLTQDLPDTFEGQVEQARINMLALLKDAGIGPEHLFKSRSVLIPTEDIPRYGPIRAKSWRA